MGNLIEIDFAANRIKRQSIAVMAELMTDQTYGSTALSYVSELRSALSPAELEFIDPRGLVSAAEFTARIISDSGAARSPTFSYLHVAMDGETRRLSREITELNDAALAGKTDDKIRFSIALTVAAPPPAEELSHYFADLHSCSTEVRRLAIFRLGVIGGRPIIDLLSPGLTSAELVIRLETSTAILRILCAGASSGERSDAASEV